MGKENFRQSYDTNKISGSDNWNFKLPQTTEHVGFPQSDAPIYSTNMSSERTRKVRDDEITDASTARDTITTEAARHGNGITPELRTGDVLVAWDIWKRDEIKWTNNSKEMEVISSGLHARSRSDQLSSRFSECIGQLGGLQYKPTTFVNPISVVEPRANSGFIRKPIQCDPTSLCINRLEGFECPMDISIQLYIGEWNPLVPSHYPINITNFIGTQTIMNYSDCGGTLVAWPTLVHNTTIRKLKMDYPWTIEPNHDSVSEYDRETSPPPTRPVDIFAHGYVADRRHELLTKFLGAVGLSRHAQSLLKGGYKIQFTQKLTSLKILLTYQQVREKVASHIMLSKNQSN
ncbi:MAG: hypothetical protein EZS28_003404 [Streblomastix strix]|uniref:Uncharacterized protein n=1 Tax=Streblomastix strix TaxID=222440 RepID=A0A5J4X354_9EUKA|nr:MAG: hypothetical protein EZS28_003404 [Streblomastix strix]